MSGALVVDLAEQRELLEHEKFLPGIWYAQTMAAHYRQWFASKELQAREMDPLEARDAAHECGHGSLPHDRRIFCACWDKVPGVLARRESVGTLVTVAPVVPLRRAA